MNRYLALTSRGLEQIAKSEIENKLSDVKVEEVSYRKVVFFYDGDIESVTQLRSIEDAFISIGKLDNIGHTRDMLERLTDNIANLDYAPAINLISKLRDLKEFSISSSSVGKRNYTYIEVKDSLSKKLSNKLSFVYDNEKHSVFDIRVFLEHSVAFVAVRIGEKPLHRRPYKLETTKATLRADIAYCMAYLAGIKIEDVVLDPMCGSGSILFEASTFKPKVLLGGDINPEAVEASRKNLEEIKQNLKVELAEWDATKLPLKTESVDKIICNLPFGKQIEIMDVSISVFYDSIAKEFKRVLKDNGRMVLLTSNQTELEKSISKEGLTVENMLETNLNGVVAKIIEVVR